MNTSNIYFLVHIDQGYKEKKHGSWVPLAHAAILATWEIEMKGIMVQDHYRQKHS
jgi:hypothetical protein